MTTYHQAGARTSGSNSLSGFSGSVFGRSEQHPQYPWNSRANVQPAISRVHEPQPPPPLPKAQEHSSRPNILVYIPPPPPPPPSNYKELGAKGSHSDSSSATKSTQKSSLSSSLKRSHSDISSSAVESRAQQPKDSVALKLPSSQNDSTVTKSGRSDAPRSTLESKSQPSGKSNSTKKLKWEPPPTKKPPPSCDLDASIDAINSLAGLQGRWQAANKVKLQSKRTRSRSRSKRQRSRGQQSSNDEVEILSPNEVAEESKSSEQVWIDVDHGEVANPQSSKEVVDLTDNKVFPPLDLKPPTKKMEFLSNSVSSGKLEDMTSSQLSSYASALENALDHTTVQANSSDGEEMEISSDEDETEEDSSRADNEEDLLDTLYTDLQTPPRLSHLRSQADEGSLSDSQNGNSQNDNAGVFSKANGESGDANAAKNSADRSDIDVAVPVADEPVEDDAVSNERKKHALRIAELKAKRRLLQLRMAKQKRAQEVKDKKEPNGSLADSLELLAARNPPPRSRSTSPMPSRESSPEKRSKKAIPDISAIRNIGGLVIEDVSLLGTDEELRFLDSVYEEEPDYSETETSDTLNSAQGVGFVKKALVGFHEEQGQATDESRKAELMQQLQQAKLRLEAKKKALKERKGQSIPENVETSSKRSVEIDEAESQSKLEELRRRQQELRQKNEINQLKNMVHSQRDLLSKQGRELTEVSAQLQTSVDSVNSKRQLLDECEKRIADMKNRKQIIERMVRRTTEQLVQTRKALNEMKKSD